MGESLDRPRFRCASHRDEMDDQISHQFNHVPTALVLCACARFYHFVPRVCTARERTDSQHRVHGMLRLEY